MSEIITPIALDATDVRLLDLLQQDASLSNVDLAARAHTSPATSQRRVRRLIEAGLIERRVAIIDAARLGHVLTAIAEVTLDRQGAEHQHAFEQRVIVDEAVQQCYRVSPGPDFVLILQVAHMDAWAAVAERLFTQDGNVRNVKTYFSVRRAKFDPRVRVSELATPG